MLARPPSPAGPPFHATPALYGTQGQLLDLLLPAGRKKRETWYDWRAGKRLFPYRGNVDNYVLARSLAPFLVLCFGYNANTPKFSFHHRCMYNVPSRFHPVSTQSGSRATPSTRLLAILVLPSGHPAHTDRQPSTRSRAGRGTRTM